MLGNWGLGSYFKAEQLTWLFEFLTRPLGLDPARLYVTVFAGAPRWGITRDEESGRLWSELFASAGVGASMVEVGTSERAAAEGIGEGRIISYDESQSWWSRAATPD